MIEIESDFIDDIFELLVLDLFLYDRKGGFEIDTTREEARKLVDKLPDFFGSDPSEYHSLCLFPREMPGLLPGFDRITGIIKQLQKQRTIKSTVRLYEAFFLKKHRKRG